jgi:hypothetical protein
MLLFLRCGKMARQGESTKMPRIEALRAWLPASSANRSPMRLSIAWIEADHIYAFTQIHNPGNLGIVPHSTVKETRQRIQEVLNLQNRLNRANSLDDKAERATALRQLVQQLRARSLVFHYGDKDTLATVEALEGIRQCGPAAIPAVRQMLVDDTIQNWHWRCVQVLAEIGAGEVERDLLGLLEVEQPYWTAIGRSGQSLKRTPFPHQRHTEQHNRAAKLFQVLYCLRALNTSDSIQAVEEFREFWLRQRALANSDRSEVLLSRFYAKNAFKRVGTQQYYRDVWRFLTSFAGPSD